MISVTDAARKYYQCDSCAESEIENDVKVREISIKFENSNHAISFKLCGKCFEQLKIKF